MENKKRIDYIFYCFLWLLKRYRIIKPNAKKMFGKYFVDAGQTNEIISQGIQSSKPFLLFRPGNAEYHLAYWLDGRDLLHSNYYKKASALFDMDGKVELAEKFVNELKKGYQYADVLCVFKSDPFSVKYLTKWYGMPKAVSYLASIEPFWDEHPWTLQLEGKRVLIVNPFVEDMIRQYEKRDKIWGERKMLPDNMTIIPVKSVWYVANDGKGEYRDWYAALDYLYSKVENETFDIALLSCGMFSVPLATRLREKGKKVIYFGGSLQLLFGIRGARWDVPGDIHQEFYNEYWIRPSRNNMPQNSNELDNECYW